MARLCDLRVVERRRMIVDSTRSMRGSRQYEMPWPVSAAASPSRHLQCRFRSELLEVRKDSLKDVKMKLMPMSPFVILSWRASERILAFSSCELDRPISTEVDSGRGD